MICRNRKGVFLNRLIIFTIICFFSTILLSAQTDKSKMITPEKAKQLLENNKTVILLDVRTAEEFAQGHIKGAKLLPYDTINQTSASLFIPTMETTIVVYCRSGRRSNSALMTLKTLGYKNVFDLGGITNWPYEVVQ